MDDPLPEPVFIIFQIAAVLLIFAVITVLNLFKNSIRSYDSSELDEKYIKTQTDLKIIAITKSERRYVVAYDILCCLISFACVFLCFRLYFSKLSEVFNSGMISATVIILGFTVIYLFCCELSEKINSVCDAKAIRASVKLTSLIGLIFYPIVFAFDKSTMLILKLFGVKFEGVYDIPTESEIRQLVDEAEEIGELEESQKEMINNVFEFDDICVENVMTHRTDIVAIENTEDINELIKQAISEGFSRIPVYDGDLDNIIGIIHVKDLLPFVGRKIPANMSVKKILRDVYFVPETKRCDDLFAEMTAKKAQMAVVVDEYGGTAGIITLEDLVESVFGSIQDEFDIEEAEIEMLTDKIFEIDGITDIDEAAETVGIDLPKGDYDTIGGMVTSLLGHIPSIDESVQVKNVIFTVIESDDRKIDKIKAEITETEAIIV